ncbi:MAG: polymer-forming cytoskeletal protein [Candidatus Roizmanbacteria bacterium]|nr:polymer-forming cytoskeletal protein [Candidatus Roizmanbacteria bacterium]
MNKLLMSLAVFFFFAVATSAIAQSPSPAREVPALQSDELVTVGENEIVTGDFFGAGERVEIYGTVNGDVYVAGGQIIIDGTVNGDVLAAGGNITISGTVTQDVRVAGGNLRIDAIIGKNLTAAGGTITIDDETQLPGNVVVGGGDVSINAPVRGNVVGGAGMLTINNEVGGSVTAGVGNLRLTPPAAVTGDVMYWSESDAAIDPAATVSGTLMRNEPREFEKYTVDERQAEKAGKALVAVSYTWKIISLLSALLIGLIVTNLAPVFTHKIGETFSLKPWQSLGAGFMVLVLTPIAAVLCMVTVIGLPLGFILLAMYGIMLYFAKIATALWIGRILTPRLNMSVGVVGQFTTGMIVYGLISLIPVIGFLLMIADLFGLGALLLTKYSFYRSFREKKLV